MPTVFPGALDNFTNPTPADDLNTPAVLHSDQHANSNDAIEALEAWVGVSGAVSTPSHEYRITQLESVTPILLGVMGWDDGVPKGTGTVIDFGNNLTATFSGTVLRVDAAGLVKSPNTTPIDTTIVDAGLRFSGGFSNFATTIIPRMGSSATGTSPIRFTSQPTGLSVVEQGAMELIGNSLQFTQLAKRRGVMMSQSVMTSSFTLVSSDAESAAIITAEHGANYAEVGKMERIHLYGTIQKDIGAPTNKLTIRVKYAGATIQTIVTDNAAVAAGTPIEILVIITYRTIGASGSVMINSKLMIDGITNVPDSATLVSGINTTSAENTTATAQFTNNSATNNLVIHQGYIECVEPNK